MDDPPQTQEAFSQEECIEWEENRNIDLRQLARSPHMQMTPALLRGTQASSAKPPSLPNYNASSQTASLVKNLNENYSPKQEIANLMEKGTEATAASHNDATQPQANVTAKLSAEALGMRHGRRRRDSSSVAKQPKKLKRSNTDPTAVKGRRRPRSSDGSSSNNSKHNQNQVSTTTSLSDGGGSYFEDLLKELDQPRAPLHPTKVNIPGNGDSTRKTHSVVPPFQSRPMPGTPPAAARAQPPQAQGQSTMSSAVAPKLLQNDDRVQNANPQPQNKSIASDTVTTAASKPPPSASATTTTGGSIHHQPLNNSTSSAPSSLPLFGDDFKLSEDDWAQMDALATKAQATRRVPAPPAPIPAPPPPAPPVPRNTEQDWKAIQAVDESLARAVGHPSVAPAAMETKQDEFDDFPMLDFEAIERQIAERAATLNNTCTAAPAPDLPVRNQVSPTFDPQRSFIAFTRYKVVGTEVDNTTYTKTVAIKEWSTSMLKDDRKRQSSIHFASMERTNTSTETNVEVPDGRIYLRGEWYHTHVDVGDIVHLCSLSGKFRTDVGALPVMLHTSPPPGSDVDDDLVLIVHPDRLIPPTTISETVTCSRRAVLRMRLGSSGMSSKAALLGTMRHELFERCMSNQAFGWPTAKVFADLIIRRNAESLVGCGVNYTEARETLLRVVPQIQRFAKDYTTFVKNKAGQAVGSTVNHRLKGNGLQPDMQFVAQSIEATEESVVCPELGLKGNLDVTVNATTSALPPTSGNQVPVPPLAVPQNALMSIELKTGHNQNPQNAHMAQLALYTMMLRVRRGPNRPNVTLSQSPSQETQGACESGMLLYLNDENYRAMHISPMQNEIKSLVGQRNLVATELSRVSRPRGVVLEYEEDKQRDGSASSLPREKEKPSISLVPAPPAALPEVLSASHSCSRCYMNRECMTYAAAQLKVSPSTSSFGVDKSHAKLLQHFTAHLSDEHLAYFQDWDRLIDLEADASESLITTAWLQSSQEQEKVSGKCMSSLVLNEMETMMANASDPGTANDHRSALVVLNRAPESSLTTPLSRLNIERGAHIVVSSDATSLHLSSRHHTPLTQYDDSRPGGQHLRHRMSIARGFLDSIDENQVTIRVTRDEMSQLSRLNQQYFEAHASSGGSSSMPSLRFRVDKDDVSTGTGTLRQNLIKFLTFDVKQSDEKDAATRASQQQLRTSQDSPLPSRQRLPWLRDAIIHLKPPTFDDSLRIRMFQGDADFTSLAAEFSKLNHDQQNAVEKIMCAQDYSLIQGLPGTGKTSTIAFVARLLAAHGKRVLITSYTHAAVDNLMIKLIESGLSASHASIPLVRVGNKASCHQNVHSILASTVALSREGEEGRDKKYPSPDSLSSVMSSAKIVGVSALTIPRSSLLVGQHYDVVIVDEAGQISQPAILGALMAADSFVLVGDHMQLPPLVQSEAAETGGYNISMLKRLADKHPSSVAQLAMQYRMHGAICQLSNDIVYAGKLRCANKKVETSLLDLSGFPTAVLNNIVNGDPATNWMIQAIDPARPLVFLDTDRLQRRNTPKKPNGPEPITFTSGLERTTGKNGRGNIVNDTEAMLVRQILHALMECGLEPSKIGVICPFRSQLRLLAQNASIEEWKSKGTEFSTIDRYQGRDKPAIVLSLVRSNPNGNCGRLLEDFRRLNVAVSRAKYKLVIIGSFATLTKGSDVLRPVLEKIQERGQIVHLPENAIKSYKQV